VERSDAAIEPSPSHGPQDGPDPGHHQRTAGPSRPDGSGSRRPSHQDAG